MPEPECLMVNRRRMLSGMAVAATGVTLGLPSQTSTATPAGPAPWRVVYDPRLQAALAFAAAARTAGHSIVPVTNDPTALWLDDLQPYWRHQQAGIVGMTRPDVAIALRMVAELVGLHTLFWGRHRFTVSGAIEHHVEGAAAIVALWREGGDWPASAHRAAIATATLQSTARPIRDRSRQPGGYADSGTLVSFALTPPLAALHASGITA